MFKKTDILSFLLLCLMVFHFLRQSPTRLLLVLIACVPMILVECIAKQLSLTGMFRIFTLFTAFLPIEDSIRALISFQSSITEYRDYLRTDISFWRLTMILLPLFAILLVCARKISGQGFERKYLSAAILLTFLFLAGILFTNYRTLCQFLFLYVATFTIAHLAEVYVYRKSDSVVAHLPFYFLAVSNVLKIKGIL